MERIYNPNPDEFRQMSVLIATTLNNHPAVIKIVTAASELMDNMPNTQMIIVCRDEVFAAHLTDCEDNMGEAVADDSRDTLARKAIGFPTEHASVDAITQYFAQRGTPNTGFDPWYARELVTDIEFVIAPENPLSFLQMMSFARYKKPDHSPIWYDSDIVKLQIDLLTGQVFDPATNKFVRPPG